MPKRTHLEQGPELPICGVNIENCVFPPCAGTGTFLCRLWVLIGVAVTSIEDLASAGGFLRSLSPLPIESTIFRKSTKLVSLGRWTGGTQLLGPSLRGSSSSVCTLCHRPVLGSDCGWVLRSLGFRGNHSSCRYPELNPPLGAPSQASLPPALLSTYCSLCPALYSLQHASSFLGEHSPGGQRSCQGGKDPAMLAWA